MKLVFKINAIFKVDMAFFDIYDDKDKTFLKEFYKWLMYAKCAKGTNFIYGSPITFLKKLPCPIKKCLMYDKLILLEKKGALELHVAFSCDDMLNIPELESNLYTNFSGYVAAPWVIPMKNNYNMAGISIVPKVNDLDKIMFKELEPYCDLGKYRKKD